MRSNKEADIEEIIANNLDSLVSTLNKSNNKVIVSISGGIDSIVLLDVILKIKKKLPIDLSLFHMNYDMHCNADKMQNLCIRIADENKLKIFTKKINSKNLFKNTNLEAKARYARYEKLSDICSKNKIDYILTAHHEDDQIETIYMHKEIHKSSWISQIGIRATRNLIKTKDHSVDIIRPMISIPKEQIINYANKNKLKFYDDPTNKDVRFLRNKIRVEIKEKIQDKKFRNSFLNIAYKNQIKINKISSDINAKISKILFFSFSDNFVILNRKEISIQSIDFFTLFLKKIISENFSFTYHASSLFWKNLFLFINSSKKEKYFILDANKNIKICKSSKYVYLYIDKRRIKKVINKIGNYTNRLGVLSVIDSDPNCKFPDKFSDKTKFLLSKFYLNKLTIDFWNIGDKCTNDFGVNMKVSDIYINNKLSIFEKKHYPIIKFENKIIWIPGMFIANIKTKLDRDDNNNNILLNWNSIL